MAGPYNQSGGYNIREPGNFQDSRPNIPLLDLHELEQERLYVAARLDRIDRSQFAQQARQLEKQFGNCNYLNWLIKRHPDIPPGRFSKEIKNEPSKRDLRRSRCPWRAKALARNQKKRNSGGK